MPKKTGHQRLWRCSWDCGFKSRGMREVFDHEEKEHDAIQYADWRKKKTLFVLFEMKFKQFKYSIEEIIGFLKNSKKLDTAMLKTYIMAITWLDLGHYFEVKK